MSEWLKGFERLTNIVDHAESLVSNAAIAIAYPPAPAVVRAYYRPWREGLSSFCLKRIEDEYRGRETELSPPKATPELMERLRRVIEQYEFLEDADPRIRAIIEERTLRVVRSALVARKDPTEWFSHVRLERSPPRPYPPTTYIEATYHSRKVLDIPSFGGSPGEERQLPKTARQVKQVVIVWGRRGTREILPYSVYRHGDAIESTLFPWEIYSGAKGALALGRALIRPALRFAGRKAAELAVKRALRKELSSVSDDVLAARLARRGLPEEAVRKNTYRITDHERGTTWLSPAERAAELRALGEELANAKAASAAAGRARREGGAWIKRKYADPRKQKLLDEHTRLMARVRKIENRIRQIRPKKPGVTVRGVWRPRELLPGKFLPSILGKDKVFYQPKVAGIGKSVGRIPDELKKTGALTRRERHAAGLSSIEVDADYVVQVSRTRGIMLDVKPPTLRLGSKQKVKYHHIDKQGGGVVVGPRGAPVGLNVDRRVVLVGPDEIARIAEARSREQLIQILETLMQEQKGLY